MIFWGTYLKALDTVGSAFGSVVESMPLIRSQTILTKMCCLFLVFCVALGASFKNYFAAVGINRGVYVCESESVVS